MALKAHNPIFGIKTANSQETYWSASITLPVDPRTWLKALSQTDKASNDKRGHSVSSDLLKSVHTLAYMHARIHHTHMSRLSFLTFDGQPKELVSTISLY